jgi:transcriptional regulator with PAS, ATPase and Fis domain
METERKHQSGISDFFLQKFSRIEHLYAQAQFGVAVLDRELRYMQVNDRLVAIDGVSIDRHIGRKLNEVDPLTNADGNKSKAARLLGISRSKLYEKLAQRQ